MWQFSSSKFGPKQKKKSEKFFWSEEDSSGTQFQKGLWRKTIEEKNKEVQAIVNQLSITLSSNQPAQQRVPPPYLQNLQNSSTACVSVTLLCSSLANNIHGGLQVTLKCYTQQPHRKVSKAFDKNPLTLVAHIVCRLADKTALKRSGKCCLCAEMTHNNTGKEVTGTSFTRVRCCRKKVIFHPLT